MKNMKEISTTDSIEMKKYAKITSKLKFDAEYFRQLLKVAQGCRTRSDFVYQAGVQMSVFQSYITLERTVAPSINFLKGIANVAWNYVSFDELCDACVGIKWYGRKVAVIEKTNDSLDFFAYIEKNRKTLELEFSKVKRFIRFPNKKEITLKNALFSKEIQLSPKSIALISNNNKTHFDTLANAFGYFTEKNSVRGNLTPVSKTKLKNFLTKKANELGLKSVLDLATLVEDVSKLDIDNLLKGKYGIKPSANIIFKLAELYNEKAGEFCLSAGYVYQENEDWNEIAQDKINPSDEHLNAEILREYLIRIIGNRTMIQFSNDANISYRTISNIMNKRYFPRKSVVMKMLAASYDGSITFDMMKKVCRLKDSVLERHDINESARNNYVKYMHQLVRDVAPNIADFSKIVNMSRVMVSKIVNGENRKPSDKSIRKFAIASGRSFEEIRKVMVEYYGEDRMAI